MISIWDIILRRPPFNPYKLPGLEAAYDFGDMLSLKVDASNRVSYAADKSGNSAVMGLVMPGASSGNYASTPDSVANSVTGDIDIVARARPLTWTAPAEDAGIVAKAKGGAGYSYALVLRSTGVLTFYYSVNGTVLLSATSSAATGFTGNNEGWVRVTRVAASGVVTFYTSTDGGATWVQLGTTTTGTTGSLADTTTALTIGALDDGITNRFGGMVLYAELRNGIGGTVVAKFDATNQTRGATSFVATTGETWTINTTGDLGARICGARDLAMLTGSKQPLLLPWIGQNYGYLAFAVTGNGFSTPDAAANRITGDIDFDSTLSLDDWTPTAASTLGGKWLDTGSNQRSWLFQVDTNGTLRVFLSADGSTASGPYSSSVAPTIADGATLQVRFTRVSSTGTITFFTRATDNDAWVQLGTTVAGITGALFNSNTSLTIGTHRVGTLIANLGGKVYRSRLFAAIGGVVAQIFDASQAANNATSWSSSTGETWTLNSTGSKPAQIVGRQSVLFDGTAYWLSSPVLTMNQPVTIYLTVKQNVYTLNSNLCASDANALRIRQGNSSGNITLYSGSAAPELGGGANVGVVQVLCAVFNGAASALRANRATAVSGDSGANNGTTLMLGARSGNEPGASQIVSEFVFSSAHDTPTQDKVIQYLAKSAGFSA